MKDVAGAAFLVAASATAGFQATVTMVVYPTLSHVRAAHWRQSHDRHVREVRPLVSVLYLALVVTSAWWLLDDWSPVAAVAVGLAALPVVLTALVAAPLHRRLVRRDDATLTRLLSVDRVRTGLAVAAVAVALAAALMD